MQEHTRHYSFLSIPPLENKKNDVVLFLKLDVMFGQLFESLIHTVLEEELPIEEVVRWTCVCKSVEHFLD